MNSNEEIAPSTSPEPYGLSEAYSVKTPDDARRLYSKWAATYESDFVDKEKYRYPKAVAELFANVVPQTDLTSVVDIGTGTGLTGMYLARLSGDYLIDGIDISPEMLAEASKKIRGDSSGVYRMLFERDLSKSVSDTNAPYDALICSGTFTHGHLGPASLDNLIPLVRSRGWFVIGVNNEHFVSKGFENKLKELKNDKIISDLVIEVIHVYEEGSAHFGDRARVLIFRNS